MRKLLMLCLPFVTVLAFGQEPVPRSYFGMDLHCCAINGTAKQASAPWPSPEFSGIRLWDSGVMWLQINPQPGVYQWEVLDSWLDKAEAHHQDVLYAFGGIPTWASGDANDPKCRSWNVPGSCHPPADLNEDGSGSNQTFKDFMSALAKHAHGRIKYWEVWNEPHNLFFWNGTMAQMVRITQDMRTIVKSIDPRAVIVSPGTGWVEAHPENGKPAWNALIWTDQYLAAGGAKSVDILAIHGYLHGVCPTGAWDLDQVGIRTEAVRKIMNQRGISDMPLWSTEGSWGPVAHKAKMTCTSDPDMQVAYVGQYHIAMWAAGYKRVYWYAWNDRDVGEMSTRDFQPTPAGKAYGEVINWMVDATLGGCDKTKSLTKCTFTRPDGSHYLAIWDSTQTCSNGNCTTAPVQVDAKYVDYLNLAGGKTNIQNNIVPVGLKPIWLEAPNASSPK